MSATAHWEVVLRAHADVAARPFEAPWGRLRVVARDQAEPGGADLTIALDPQAAKHGWKADVIWHPAATSADGGARVVARPWPVAEDLFDSMPTPRDGCLVIGPARADAERVVARFRERQMRVRLATGATRDLLAEARIVVSLAPGLPAETFAILAAGRLLVAPAGAGSCGLQPWIDHVTFSNEDELVELVDALAAYPEAWRPIEAFARQSAEPHRAGQAIGRLVRRMQAGA